MYRANMYITIQTLLGQGKSIKSISRDLQISRNTVRSIKRELESGKTHPEATARKKLLENHLPLVRKMHSAGLTALLIHERLVEKHGVKISYATVARCVGEFSTQETYIVQKTPVGQEA